MLSTILLIIAVLAAGAAAAALIYGAYDMFASGGRFFKRHVEARSLKELDDLYQAIEPARLVLLTLLSMIIFTALLLVVFKNILGVIIGLFCGYVVPKWYLRMLVRQRRRLFLKQLPDAVSLMANALKAGNSFAQALETVHEEMEAPVSQEFHYVLQRYRLGENMQHCLEALGRRMNDPDLSLVITATLVSLQTGCNLAEMYGRLAEIMRQKYSLHGKIRSLTSQGKMQGLVVGLLPVFLLLVVNFLNPATLDFFINSFAGGVLLSAGVLLELLGMYAIRKIVSIDV